MYKTMLSDLNNVTVAYYSPRQPGEHEAQSDWKELTVLCGTPKARANDIRRIADDYNEVWFRPSTYGGRARLWVKA